MEGKPEGQKVFKIEKVEPVEISKKIDIAKSIETEEIAPSKMKFDTAITKAAETPSSGMVAPVDKSESILLSPIHEMSARTNKVGSLEPATQERILDKAATIQNTMSTTTETIQNTLQRYPELRISPEEGKELTKRLTHVDATLQSSLNLAGIEATTPPPVAAADVKNPLVTFVSYLTHGDKQMKSLTKEIESIGKDPTITPGRLLSIQIKLNFVQQEIDFFSSALNKALESADRKSVV